MNTYQSDVLRTLSDPTRLAIFERLGDGPISVADLAREFPVSRPAVSQHLKVLKEAGLVVGEIEGPRVSYCASRERLAALHEQLGVLLEEAREVDTSGCD